METDASSLTEDQIDHILTQYHSGKITIGCAARNGRHTVPVQPRNLNDDMLAAENLCISG